MIKRFINRIAINNFWHLLLGTIIFGLWLNLMFSFSERIKITITLNDKTNSIIDIND